ncbi:hypothetical protein C446_13739, partial [Halobiforma nitratireducens JCM 10879]
AVTAANQTSGRPRGPLVSISVPVSCLGEGATRVHTGFGGPDSFGGVERLPNDVQFSPTTANPAGTDTRKCGGS